MRTRLRECYDRLWSEAIGTIRAGSVETDPVLAAGMPDRRRGLTLIARPSPLVRRRVAAFLDGLREIEPEQHYYAPSELHVTVLSLFTATVDHAPLLARTASYVSAADAAIPRPRHRPFGATTVRSVSLVETDWYMTRQTARTVKRYRLSGQAAFGRCSQEARTPAARIPRTTRRR